MNDIKKSLIKIAYQNPNLRKDIINIVDSNNKEHLIKGLVKIAYFNPSMRKDILPYIEKLAATKGTYKSMDKAIAEGQAQKKKAPSTIPQNVYDAAKNETYSNFGLQTYLKSELGKQKIKNPALKDNPNAQKEVAISTILNHATNKNDPYFEDSKNILKEFMDRITQTYEKETGEKGKEKGKEEGGEETTIEQPKEKAVEGSPQSIAEQKSQELEEKIDTKVDEIVDLPEEQQEQEIEDTAYGTLAGTVTDMFENLGVPNAEEVGDGVIENRKEEKKEKEEHEQKLKALDEEEKKQAQETKQQINATFASRTKDTYDEMEEELLDFEDIMPEVFDNIEKDIKWNDDEEAYFHVPEDISKVLNESAKSVRENPTLENINTVVNNLPGPIQTEIVEELKENGANRETVAIVVATAEMVSETVENPQNYYGDYYEERIEELETPSEPKKKGWFKGMMETFQNMTDSLKFGKDIIDSEKTKEYLEEKGLTKEDLYGDKRKEVLDVLNKVKDIKHTEDLLKEHLPKGVSTPLSPNLINEMASLKGKLKDRDFEKLVSLTLGGNGKKITEEDQNSYVGEAEDFKEEFEKHKELMDKAKKLGVNYEDIARDESKIEILNKANEFLKDKNIEDSLKRQITKEFMNGKITEKDTDLLGKVLNKELDTDEKLLLERGDNALDSFKKLKLDKDKKEQIKEFASTKQYKDDTLFDAPPISYDQIVEMSKSKDPDDSAWAKEKLKSIEKEYDEDIKKKTITQQKQREQIEALFKPEQEGGKPLKIKDDTGNKYTIEEVYDLAEDSSNPAKQAWAAKTLDGLKKSLSGELEADAKEVKEQVYKEHEEEKNKLVEEHEKKKTSLNEEHTKKIKDIDDSHATKQKEIEDTYTNKKKDIDTHYETEKKKIEEGVAQDIAKLNSDHETRVKKRKEEGDKEINEIIKNELDVEGEQKKIDEKYLVLALDPKYQGDEGEKLKEEEKQKDLKSLEEKRKEIINNNPDAQKKNTSLTKSLNSLQKKPIEITNKEKAKEKALKQLEDETALAKTKADEDYNQSKIDAENEYNAKKTQEYSSHEDTMKNTDNEHKKQIKDKQKELTTRIKNISKQHDEELSEEEGIDLHFQEMVLDELSEEKQDKIEEKMKKTIKKKKKKLTDEEIEEESVDFVNNNRKLFSEIPDDDEAVFAARILLQSLKNKKPQKKTEPSSDKKVKEEEKPSKEDLSMTQYFGDRTWDIVGTLSTGRKKTDTLDFKKLLSAYKKAKSKNNPYDEEYTDQVIEQYEDAKKEYKQQAKTNKKASIYITSKEDKKEQIKQKIREMSKFEESDFEELKPYFNDNLEFDKEKYLEDKKKGRLEKNKERDKEIEARKDKLELRKTKVDMMILKKQMQKMTQQKQASIKNKLIKIALSSKPEIKNIILNHI